MRRILPASEVRSRGSALTLELPEHQSDAKLTAGDTPAQGTTSLSKLISIVWEPSEGRSVPLTGEKATALGGLQKACAGQSLQAVPMAAESTTQTLFAHLHPCLVAHEQDLSSAAQAAAMQLACEEQAKQSTDPKPPNHKHCPPPAAVTPQEQPSVSAQSHALS
mmetsp:Transcript_52038/g.96371  ORF Transcript_52038/g.96371 Transcript_52038/m.96371 type:complete len:164 (+) Transcript_52038:1506-1997(+)